MRKDAAPCENTEPLGLGDTGLEPESIAVFDSVSGVFKPL